MNYLITLYFLFSFAYIANSQEMSLTPQLISIETYVDKKIKVGAEYNTHFSSIIIPGIVRNKDHTLKLYFVDFQHTLVLAPQKRYLLKSENLTIMLFTGYEYKKVLSSIQNCNQLPNFYLNYLTSTPTGPNTAREATLKIDCPIIKR